MHAQFIDRHPCNASKRHRGNQNITVKRELPSIVCGVEVVRSFQV